MNKTQTPPKHAGSENEGTSENGDMTTWLFIAFWHLLKWCFIGGIAIAKSNWSLPDDDETIELAAAVPVGITPSLEGNLRWKAFFAWVAAVIGPLSAVAFMFLPLLFIGWGLSFWLYRPWARALVLDHILLERENGTLDARKEITFDDLRHRNQSDAAKKAVIGLPATINGTALLGTIVRDLNRPKQDRLEDWKADLNGIGISATGLKLPSTPPHWVMVGESGSGKTESMKRIASAALEEGAQVFFIDGKGDAKTALEFKAIAEGAGKTCAMWPDLAFDIFRGKPSHVKDRLESMLCLAAPDSAAAYYDQLSMLLIGAVVNRPSGCPRNFDDFLEGLRSAHTTGEPARALEIAEKLATPRGKQELQGTVLKMRNLRNHLSELGAVDNDRGQRASWSWDGLWHPGSKDPVPIDAGYVRIQTSQNEGAAQAMARVVLKDFDQWLGTPVGDRIDHSGAYPYSKQRFRDGRPVYLFLDEYSALSDSSAKTLIGLGERGRSKGARVFMSVQSYMGLGRDPGEREQIITAGCGIWAHRIAKPDEFIKIIGTEHVTEAGHQTGDGDTTGVATLRRQQSYSINPEDLKTLATGEAVVAVPGVGVQVRIAQAVVPGTTNKAPEVEATSHQVAEYNNRLYAEQQVEVRRIEQAQRQTRQVDRGAPDTPQQGQSEAPRRNPTAHDL